MLRQVLRRFVATQPPPSALSRKEFKVVEEDVQNRETTGVQPTRLQRRLLVIAGLYNAGKVPEFVPSDQMTRLSDRIRTFVVFMIALSGSALFITYDIKNRQQVVQDNAIIFDAQPYETSECVEVVPTPDAFVRVRGD
ncbi:hypothetical protein M3Y94_01002600 [Aphelenchoides besseyi]|nr:hypothetical protein M3Y94_01002600 [Aphelenchoides besseyi]KAI6220407.1 hypothetical protein M3Y95_01036800 [Aphelenchoides besseyi]